MPKDITFHSIKVKTADLVPYARNSRTHDDAQIAQIAASIREFGFTNPVIIDEDNGIIAGHGRVLAAQKLSIDKVPCVQVKGWTEAQKKAYVIADNKLALNAGWDEEMLALEFDELAELDFDLEMTGFTLAEIQDLMPDEENEGLTDEDEVPELTEDPVSIEGDVWQLGNHRLMCGDSTDAGSVALLMDGVNPDIVYTDPPYGMNAVSKSGVLSKNYKGDILGDDDADVAKKSFELIYGLFPDAKHVWWGANYYSSVLPDSECWMVWNKNNGESDQTDCELAWANFRSVVRMFTQASEKTNRMHPTQKPVSLIEWVFRRFKYKANSMLDLFGGSGSTLIACEKTNRKCYMMELDPHYMDVIIKRWEEYTGQKAVHLESGKDYDTLGKERGVLNA